MANTIEYAEKFLPIIDDIYKAESVTECLDSTAQTDFSGSPEVKILKVTTTGLGDYSRSDGYPKGDVSVAWETLALGVERGKELSIDRMDDEETLGMAFGTATGNFVRDWVIPEMDAYRFAKYASASGISTATAAALTKDTILGAIDEAVRQMDEDEVPESGRILFVNSELKPLLNQAIARQWGNIAEVSRMMTSYNGMKVRYVPKSRFYTAVTLADGEASFGFSKTSGAKQINFMLIEPQAVLQAKKFAMPKIFSPDENQQSDMWKFQFRLYHDAFVYDNKKKGIYLHASVN